MDRWFSVLVSDSQNRENEKPKCCAFHIMCASSGGFTSHSTELPNYQPIWNNPKNNDSLINHACFTI